MNTLAHFLNKVFNRFRVILCLDTRTTLALRKKCKLEGWGAVYVYPKNKIRVAKKASIHVINGVLVFSKPWFEVNDIGPCAFEMENGSKLKCFGDFDFIRGSKCIVKEGAILHLGSGGRIGKGSELRCNGEINIGAHCWISDNVTISDAGKIVIEDGVWIGNGAKIEGNLRIGENVVIGEGVHVTTDIEDEKVITNQYCRF